MKIEGESNFNLLYNGYKTHARSRNLEFNLTKEEFRILTKGNCNYCNIEPSSIKTRKRCNGSYIYNGVDRKDNSIGYILENCTPCCGTCNSMKSNLSLEDFKNKIISIYNHLK